MQIILLILLVIFTSSAVAEWRKVSITPFDSIDYYADSATIRRSNDNATMWHVLNLRIEQSVGGKSYASVKVQSEYNCNSKRARLLSHSYHSGKMGSGDIIYSADTTSNGSIVYSDDGIPDAWFSIREDSNDEALWKFACGKP